MLSEFNLLHDAVQSQQSEVSQVFPSEAAEQKLSNFNAQQIDPLVL